MRSKEEDELVRDGEAVRVPFAMMDAQQRSLAAGHGAHDGLGNPAGFRSGFVYGSPAADARRKTARGQYIKNTRDAWRTADATRAEATPGPIAEEAPRDAYCRELSNAWRGAR